MDSLRDIYKAILRNLDPARRVAPNDNTLNILRQICEALGIKWRTHDSLRDLWKKIAESIGIRITRSDSIYDILYKIAQRADTSPGEVALVYNGTPLTYEGVSIIFGPLLGGAVLNRHTPYPRLLKYIRDVLQPAPVDPRVFILDEIDEPSAVAFSVFVLSRDMLNSPIMQVRRDTDNDEVQVLPDLTLVEPRISLDSPLVGSASTFGDFLGSASGFVFSWFDQSGNARHASQATTGNQPRIANAGVLETNSNGRVAVSFVGSGRRLTLTNAGGLYRNLAQARTFFVGERPTSVGTQVGFLASTGASTTAARCGIAVLGGNYLASGRRLDGDSFASSTQPHSEGLKLIINRSRWGDGNVQLRINGSDQTAANYPSGAGSTADADSLLVEMGQAGNSNWGGTISETIVYRSALAGTESILEQNVAARYGITIA